MTTNIYMDIMLSEDDGMGGKTPLELTDGELQQRVLPLGQHVFITTIR